MDADQAVVRYEAAMSRRAAIEKEWKRLGKPLLTEGGATGRAVVPHPLVKMLAEADALCDRLGKSAARRPSAGRPQGTESAPDRTAAPPRVRLKAV